MRLPRSRLRIIMIAIALAAIPSAAAARLLRNREPEPMEVPPVPEKPRITSLRPAMPRPDEPPTARPPRLLRRGERGRVMGLVGLLTRGPSAGRIGGGPGGGPVMRAPRAQLTLRSMMLGMIAIAVPVSAAVVALRRPYPVAVVLVPSGMPADRPGYVENVLIQRWSDGQAQVIGPTQTRVVGNRRHNPFVRVDWSDDSSSYRLAR
jgi:hypothetical protein